MAQVTPSLEIDGVTADFCRSLAGVIAWARLCITFRAQMSSAQTVFRSPALRPIEERFIPIEQRFTGDELDLTGPFDAVRQLIRDLVAAREQRLHHLGVALPTHDSAYRLLEEARGALIAYLPEQNTSDGAAAGSSRSFFDGGNVPPWDLWIDLMRCDATRTPWRYRHDEPTLVSWVPEPYVELARRGMDVIPEQCTLFAALAGS